jgi:hypothetical protein
MHALETMHGWGWLLIIAGIFGWSALMLLLSIAILRLWPRRDNRWSGEQPPTGTAR